MDNKALKCSYCGSSNLAYDYTERSDFDRTVMELEITSTFQCGECDEYTRYWEKYKVGELLENEVTQA